jgi:hypothetical protein
LELEHLLKVGRTDNGDDCWLFIPLRRLPLSLSFNPPFFLFAIGRSGISKGAYRLKNQGTRTRHRNHHGDIFFSSLLHGFLRWNKGNNKEMEMGYGNGN